MSQPQLALRSGHVYRTGDFLPFSANPTRFAKRLVQQGRLQTLAQGLFVHPRQGRFGSVPPTDEEVMRSFLRDSPFVFTGPERWNALGLGSTATFAAVLVYNEKRSGEFTLGGRRYLLRRVRFPRRPTPEWFAVDLIENAGMAGVSWTDLERGLARAVKEARLDRDALRRCAAEYGTKSTQAFVQRATN
jgi:hypothetical protein